MTTPRLPPPTISGLSLRRRIVALLDRGVERVAVDVGDGERVELGVAQHARREAGRAARRLRDVGEAVAAEAGRHGASRCGAGERQPRARRRRTGRCLRARRKRAAAARSTATWSSTPARKCGSLGGGAQRFRTDAGQREEGAEPLGILGEERQRRDRERLGACRGRRRAPRSLLGRRFHGRMPFAPRGRSLASGAQACGRSLGRTASDGWGRQPRSASGKRENIAQVVALSRRAISRNCVAIVCLSVILRAYAC